MKRDDGMNVLMDALNKRVNKYHLPPLLFPKRVSDK